MWENIQPLLGPLLIAQFIIAFGVAMLLSLVVQLAIKR